MNEQNYREPTGGKDHRYQPRTYREWVKGKDLVAFSVVVKQTDLYILASTDLKKKALGLVSKYRNDLEKYIEQNPTFLVSIVPLPAKDDAPPIVKAMSETTARVGVGPMAAVAGAISEFVGTDLLPFTREIIIENGGDIFLKCVQKRRVAIFAGSSPLSARIGLEIEGKDTPMGICTSSGTVGHSLSFGLADAVVTLSPSATMADAAATAIANRVAVPEDISAAIEFAQSVEGLTGVVIIKDDKMGAWGEVKLCEMSAE